MFRYLWIITGFLLLVIGTNVLGVSKADTHTCDVHFSIEILDKKNIKGTGLKDETTKLYINDEYVDATQVNDKDEFRFELKDDLKHDDIIQVELGKNKLKLKYDDIKESNTKSFEGTFYCSDLQIKTEEQNGEIEKSDSDTDNDKEAEKEKENESDIDKEIEDGSESDVNEENEKEDEVESDEENNEEKSEEEAEKEPDDTEEDKVKEESSDNKKPDSDVKEEKKSRALRSAETEKLIDAEKVCGSTNEYNNYISDHLNSGAVPQKVQGKVECVSNASEFNSAITSSNVEVIVLKNNIVGVGRKYINSNYNQKIIDGNGYELIMKGSNRLKKINSSITDIIVKDVSNLFTENTNPIEGMFRSTKPGHLHIINSNFNVNNDPSGGHIGASWESTLHFYGKVIMNTNAEYGAYYRYYKVHKNAHLELNASQGGLRSQYNKKGSEEGKLNGLELLDNAYASITSKKQALYSDGSYFKYVEAGKNSQLFLTSKNSHAVQFADPERFHLISHDNGTIIMKSPDSPLISEGTGDVKVDNQGTLELDRTGTENGPVFDVTHPLNINIYYPKNVVFHNNKGTIFNTNNSSLKNFDLKYTTVEKQDKNGKVLKTPPFNTGKFTIQNNTTKADSNITSVYPDFNTTFLPSLNYLKFEGDISANMKVKSPILETNKTVTGTANKESTIKMINLRTNQSYQTKSDKNGKFSFDIANENFKVDDKLEFFTIVDNYDVLGAEEVVVGNKLELRPVKDIEFEETEIKDQPNHIIHRVNDEHNIEVLNSKNANFQVNVYSEGPLTNDKDTIKNALYFVQDNQFHLIEGDENRQVVATKDNTVKEGNIYTTQFDKDSGILLRLNPIDVHKKGTYKTKLTWTLTDGP